MSSSSICNLVYAERDGRMLHISEVEGGLACGCTCPECGESLVARKGKVRGWHFAHRSGSTACGTTAPETALHKLAKELFGTAVSFVLPPVRACVEDIVYTICKSSRQFVSRSELEAYRGGVRPDVVVWDKYDREYFVEVLVTHRVDDGKVEKLAELGVPAVEIDLSDMPRDISRESLAEAMLNSCDLWKYVYHPAIAPFVAKKKAELIALRKKEEDDARRRKEEEERAERIRLEREALEREEQVRQFAVRQSRKMDLDSAVDGTFTSVLDKFWDGCGVSGGGRLDLDLVPLFVMQAQALVKKECGSVIAQMLDGWKASSDPDVVPSGLSDYVDCAASRAKSWIEEQWNKEWQDRWQSLYLSGGAQILRLMHPDCERSEDALLDHTLEETLLEIREGRQRWFHDNPELKPLSGSTPIERLIKAARCPRCGASLDEIRTTPEGYRAWICRSPRCGLSWTVDVDAEEFVLADRRCPKCGRKMSVQVDARGVWTWQCPGDPSCGVSYPCREDGRGGVV